VYASTRPTRTDQLRDEFHARIESIRNDMLAQVAAAANHVMTAQNRAIVVLAIVTAIASVLGFVFAKHRAQKQPQRSDPLQPLSLPRSQPALQMDQVRRPDPGFRQTLLPQSSADIMWRTLDSRD